MYLYIYLYIFIYIYLDLFNLILLFLLALSFLSQLNFSCVVSECHKAEQLKQEVKVIPILMQPDKYTNIYTYVCITYWNRLTVHANMPNVEIVEQQMPDTETEWDISRERKREWESSWLLGNLDATGPGATKWQGTRRSSGCWTQLQRQQHRASGTMSRIFFQFSLHKWCCTLIWFQFSSSFSLSSSSSFPFHRLHIVFRSPFAISHCHFGFLASLCWTWLLCVLHFMRQICLTIEQLIQ